MMAVCLYDGPVAAHKRVLHMRPHGVGDLVAEKAQRRPNPGGCVRALRDTSALCHLRLSQLQSPCAGCGVCKRKRAEGSPGELVLRNVERVQNRMVCDAEGQTLRNNGRDSRERRARAAVVATNGDALLGDEEE